MSAQPSRFDKPLQARTRDWLLNTAFHGYKRVLGPALHMLSPVRGGCPYQPTCSEYATLACAEHGLLRGGVMAAWRLLRCNPLSRGGWDPVPPARHSHSTHRETGNVRVVFPPGKATGARRSVSPSRVKML